MQNNGMKSIFKPGNNTGIDTNFLVSMGASGLVIVVLWLTPLLFPFRMFVTIVHELGHAVTSVATGGIVRTIEINPDGSGLAYVGGGFTLLVASAGYLGSTLVGGTMLLLAKRERGRRFVLWGVVGVLAIGTVFLVRDLQTLGIMALVAAVYGLCAWKGPDLLLSFVLYTTALLACFYAVTDLITLFNINSSGRTVHNDAVILQNSTGIPAIVWTILWILVGGIILFQFMMMAIKTKNKASSTPQVKTVMDKWL